MFICIRQYLAADIKIPDDKVHQAADIMVKHLTNTVKELRHLFLIGDLVDSIKVGEVFFGLEWVVFFMYHIILVHDYMGKDFVHLVHLVAMGIHIYWSMV